MRTAAIAAAVALLGGPARAPAIDLTGVWTSSKDVRCSVLDSSGTKSNGTYVSPQLDVDQNGVDLLVNNVFGVPWDGRVFSDSKKDVGRGLFSYCGPVAGTDNVFLIRSAKTFPENGAGVSGRMTLEWVLSTSGQLFVCKKVVLERTSTDPGLLNVCP
jgi:hypothetical protein